MGCGVRMWVRCPCPPVRIDVVTPRHLFLFFPIYGALPWFPVRGRHLARKQVVHLREDAKTLHLNRHLSIVCLSFASVLPELVPI